MVADPLHLVSEAERMLLVMTARGDRTLFGEVRRTSDGRRWRIDARPYGWIHGLAGVSFGDNREMAEALLNVIRVKIAQGVPRAEAVAEFLPVVAEVQRIRHRYESWLQHMDDLVEIGDRSPLTVREYRRYARKRGELDWRPSDALGQRGGPGTRADRARGADEDTALARGAGARARRRLDRGALAG